MIKARTIASAAGNTSKIQHLEGLQHSTLGNSIQLKEKNNNLSVYSAPLSLPHSKKDPAQDEREKNKNDGEGKRNPSYRHIL